MSAARTGRSGPDMGQVCHRGGRFPACQGTRSSELRRQLPGTVAWWAIPVWGGAVAGALGASKRIIHRDAGIATNVPLG